MQLVRVAVVMLICVGDKHLSLLTINWLTVMQRPPVGMCVDVATSSNLLANLTTLQVTQALLHLQEKS